MIAGTVEAALAAQAPDRTTQLQGLVQAVRATFHGRPRPPRGCGIDVERGARLLRWLGSVMRRLPKTTKEIADSFAGQLLAPMPVHDRLGRDDDALLHGAMHVGLATISHGFLISIDAPALAGALVATS